MQEINLLQNKLKDQSTRWERNNRLITVFLSIVLIAVLGGAVMFYLMNSRALDQAASLNQDNVKLQTELDRMRDELGDAVSFQAQTKNIETILSSHVIWNDIISELSTTAFKGSKYINFSSATNGMIHIEGQTADYSELGKVLLSLETSGLFEKVRLISSTPATGGEEALAFSIDATVDQQVFISEE